MRSLLRLPDAYFFRSSDRRCSRARSWITSTDCVTRLFADSASSMEFSPLLPTMLSNPTYMHTGSIIHRQPLYGRGPRGAEHGGLPRLPAGAHGYDVPHVLLEAHVKHVIGLVEDEVAHVPEVAHPLVDEWQSIRNTPPFQKMTLMQPPASLTTTAVAMTAPASMMVATLTLTLTSAVVPAIWMRFNSSLSHFAIPQN